MLRLFLQQLLKLRDFFLLRRSSVKSLHCLPLFGVLSASGIKQPPSFGIGIKTWQETRSRRTLKSHNCSEWRIKDLDYKGKGNKASSSMEASWPIFLLLCVVCNRSEEHVPRRDAPRLLRLITCWGAEGGVFLPWEAVWQYLLGYQYQKMGTMEDNGASCNTVPHKKRQHAWNSLAWGSGGGRLTHPYSALTHAVCIGLWML